MSRIRRRPHDDSAATSSMPPLVAARVPRAGDAGQAFLQTDFLVPNSSVGMR